VIAALVTAAPAHDVAEDWVLEPGKFKARLAALMSTSATSVSRVSRRGAP
jgi:hypothetical protein